MFSRSGVGLGRGTGSNTGSSIGGSIGGSTLGSTIGGSGMGDPNVTLMPTMPPPGSLSPLQQQQQQQQQQQLPVPRVAGRRAFVTVADRDSETHTYRQPPVKRITDEASLRAWAGTEAYLRILDFVQSLNEAVTNKKVSDPCPVSENIAKAIAVLDVLDSWIDDIPPEDTPQRFGNMAFRKWAQRLAGEAQQLSALMLPDTVPSAKIELAVYLAGGFGDGTRIDYGSGHELAFCAWLCCLDLLGVFGPADHQALVTRVFVRYLALVRRLQRVYMLEPAGSHGVWGLDDHQFLPYLWGSAQLLNHPRIKPKSIMQRDIVAHFHNEYLYLACIQYIHDVKRGPFHEHSPMLYDISGVAAWAKVNSGMLKMYAAEVLHKLPVIQHFYFGELLPFEPAHDISPPAAPPAGQ
ncbi:hypothetical protein BC831DRAFT_476697 [Entophlyctis helioformis]|nr:hypothetical protein BC831DRAFT_476697 [Entophlyctis helioformis]